MIQRLVGIVVPIVNGQQGSVFKQEADNVFAVFPSVLQAVDASMEILDALAIANQSLPPNQSLYASMGIGYGDLIPIFREDVLCDVFGNEMNLSSKLGEDLADPSEVLLTEAAHQQIQSPAYTYDPRTVTISKVNLVAYRVSRTVS
ncbi:MAG: hypothetical protein F6K09_20480 [Merismopedia sp. SIO2A8]|nr:hypothetical protein [Merismopedia sp. SIO2A8]